MHSIKFCHFTSNFPLLVRAISWSLLTERVFSSEELFDSPNKLYVYTLTVELLWDKRALISSAETSVLPASKISCVNTQESKSDWRQYNSLTVTKNKILLQYEHFMINTPQNNSKFYVGRSALSFRTSVHIYFCYFTFPRGFSRPKNTFIIPCHLNPVRKECNNALKAILFFAVLKHSLIMTLK